MYLTKQIGPVSTLEGSAVSQTSSQYSQLPIKQQKADILIKPYVRGVAHTLTTSTELEAR